ncbi:hypothetical protein PRIC1_012769 [Phytophthora ramorum]|nr:hypothetical protein KRP22_14405 [Phytophthora ramorum]
MRLCYILVVVVATFLATVDAMPAGANAVQTSVSKLAARSAKATPVYGKRALRKRGTDTDDDEDRIGDITQLISLPNLFKQMEGKSVHKFAHFIQGGQYSLKQREAMIALYAAHLAKLAKAANTAARQ